MRRPIGLILALLLPRIGLASALEPSEPSDLGDFSFSSRTVYHAYQVRLGVDGAKRDLNQLSEQLDADARGVGPDGRYDATISLRYRTDLGTGFHRDTPNGAGLPAVDGRDQVEVLSAFVDARALAGALDLRLGRQLLVDELSWLRLDGLSGFLRPSRALTLRAYVGQPVPFDWVLGPDALTGDGTQVSDGPALAMGGSASFEFGRALAVGASVRRTITFRGDELVVFGEANDARLGGITEQTSAGQIGVLEQRAGLSARGAITQLALSASGDLVWDLLFGRLESASARLAFDPSPSFRAELSAERVHPVFLGDSIFNVFNLFDTDRAGLEVTVRPFAPLFLDAGWTLQAFRGGPKGPKSSEDPGGEGLELDASSLSHGPHATVGWDAEHFSIGASFEAATNTGGRHAYGGNYRMLELFGRAALSHDASVHARASFTGFQDDWFEDADLGEVMEEERSTTFAAGANLRLGEMISARIDLARSFGSFLDGSYRVTTLVEVTP
ncbi:MAG: hypothetical protein HYV07_17755 [Deltaproteobacteria bacterium]|nr:hypothetical protein [Deltaproteobacteria bacterium]